MIQSIDGKSVDHYSLCLGGQIMLAAVVEYVDRYGFRDLAKILANGRSLEVYKGVSSGSEFGVFVPPDMFDCPEDKAAKELAKPANIHTGAYLKAIRDRAMELVSHSGAGDLESKLRRT